MAISASVDKNRPTLSLKIGPTTFAHCLEAAAKVTRYAVRITRAGELHDRRTRNIDFAAATVADDWTDCGRHCHVPGHAQSRVGGRVQLRGSGQVERRPARSFSSSLGCGHG